MKKPKAKQRILETASALFHQRGYSEVGINEIIAKAETAKATFYQHFPSKERLCEAWLEEAHERSEVRRQAILDGPGSAAEKVDMDFAHMENVLGSSDFRGCPYSNTSAVVQSGCVGILRQVSEHKQAIREFFRKLAGEIVGDQAMVEAKCPSRLGDAIFVLHSGAITEAQNLREIWPVQAARCAAAQLCAAAMSADAKAPTATL